MQFTFNPILFFNHISMLINEFSISMLFIIHIFTYIRFPILKRVWSISFFFALFVFTFILLSIWPDEFSCSIHFIIFPLTNIGWIVWHFYSKPICFWWFKLAFIVWTIRKYWSSIAFFFTIDKICFYKYSFCLVMIKFRIFSIYSI